ncbi:hypothetical protein RJ639_047705 [Escallonia herrerae]|uniref:Uncharacterized protein n=1 Tax=Escallonia herrerae TaxID=1293975 RepID=A0AA89AYJ5_9ASTE|nr:hypothetical protein RJ639_047705 [Escallonia herrerae]
MQCGTLSSLLIFSFEWFTYVLFETSICLLRKIALCGVSKGNNEDLVWTVHGEGSSSHSNRMENDVELNIGGGGAMHEMVNDIFTSRSEDPCVKVANFYKYMSDVDRPLYSGCKTETKLSFIVWLFNLKCTSKWTDKSVDLLLGYSSAVNGGANSSYL